MINLLSSVNPEFQRNLWKEFSLHRIIAMPLILAVIFYIFYATNDGSLPSIQLTAAILITLLLIVWGTGLSADAIFQEIQEQSWEIQRMTPLSAWSMAWGKLLGSTSYAWYGAFLCSVAYLISSLLQPNHSSSHIWFKFCSLILSGSIAQSFSLFCALLIQRISPMRSRVRVTFIQIVAILFFWPVTYFGSDYIPEVYSTYNWYYLNFSYSSIVLFSQLFVQGWLLIGIYRLLRIELQIKTYPWVWSVFVAVSILYTLGYLYNLSFLWTSRPTPPLAVMLLIAYFFSLSYTFLSAFFSPKNIVYSYRLAICLKNKDYWQAFALTPCWVISIGISFILMLSFLSFGPQHFQKFSERFDASLFGFSLGMFLFLLRDIGLLYFICWNPKAKKPHLTTIIYLIILYALLPSFLSLIGFPEYWLPVVFPGAWFMSGITILQSLVLELFILLQIPLVLYGVRYRWQQNLAHLLVK